MVQISTQQHYDQPAQYIANDDYLSTHRGTYAKRNAAKNQPVYQFHNPTGIPFHQLALAGPSEGSVRV